LQRRRCKNPHQNENADCQLNADDLKNHFLCYERRCFRLLSTVIYCSISVHFDLYIYYSYAVMGPARLQEA
jgi:hypothetical protein